MTENEFLLQDRLGVIRDTINKYGEENFYLSFSGGKDSTVVHYLLDIALPDNRIPRVFSNTGIEYNAIIEFVRDMAKQDDRIIMIKPSKNIKKTLEEEGYPFKSKGHSRWVNRYKKSGKTIGVLQYLGEREDKKPWSSSNSCPKNLKYQFSNECNLYISDKCCELMKEEPLKKWQKENHKKVAILGLMAEEGGRRTNSKCIVYQNGKLKFFQPLAKVTHEWERWFIENYGIRLCKLYYEPYNFERTGCKGCPFSLSLQKELNTIEKYFPNERKQCEYIWKPVYDEYRRLGYRLDSEEQTKLF